MVDTYMEIPPNNPTISLFCELLTPTLADGFSLEYRTVQPLESTIKGN